MFIAARHVDLTIAAKGCVNPRITTDHRPEQVLLPWQASGGATASSHFTQLCRVDLISSCAWASSLCSLDTGCRYSTLCHLLPFHSVPPLLKPLTCDSQRRQLLRSHIASVSESDCRNCTRAFCWCHLVGCHRVRVVGNWKCGRHYSMVLHGWVRLDGPCPIPPSLDWSWYL